MVILAAGLDFELLFVISSGDDAVHEGSANNDHGGSYGYCGIKGERYPDKKAMGYPIDRRVPDDRLFRQSNIKWTTVKVFHHDE